MEIQIYFTLGYLIWLIICSLSFLEANDLICQFISYVLANKFQLIEITKKKKENTTNAALSKIVIKRENNLS